MFYGDSYGRAYPPRRFEIKPHYDNKNSLVVSHYDIDDNYRPFGVFKSPFAAFSTNDVDVLHVFQVKEPNANGFEMADIENQLDQLSLPNLPTKEIEISNINDTIRARTVGSVKL